MYLYYYTVSPLTCTIATTITTTTTITITSTVYYILYYATCLAFTSMASTGYLGTVTARTQHTEIKDSTTATPPYFLSRLYLLKLFSASD